MSKVGAAGLPAMAATSAAPASAPAEAATRTPNVHTAFAEIRAWVGKAFPGAVVAVGVHGRLVALKAFGRISSAPDAPPMPRNAIFDLASLTKVVGTTTAAEILYDRGLLDLDRPVVAYLPSFAGTPGHERITVRHLLSHSSGLFTTDLLWQHSRNRQELLALIDRMPMAWAPGTHYQYRDENMILMGEIIVAKSDKNASWDGRGDIYNDDMANPGSMFMTINPPNSTVADAIWCVNNGDKAMPCVAAAGTNGQQASRSRHSGGVNGLLADGSVKFFTNSIQSTTWRYLGASSDGQAIPNY